MMVKLFTRHIKSIVVAGLLLAFSTSLSSAQAQESDLSTSISPVTFELTSNPGETVTNFVKVTNLASDSQDYTMDIEPFIGNEIGQATVIPADDDPHPELALKDWVTLSPIKFTLAPKQQQLVSVKISIPKNAEPGGRYGSILASATGDNSLTGTGAKVRQRIGTLVLLHVQGSINYRANLKDFKADRSLYERSPVSFTTRIHNDSTVHIKPKGFITISNIFGRKVVDLEVDQRNILPNSDRLLTKALDKKLGIGHYSATLTLVYGEKDEQLTGTTSFNIFPWKIGLPLIAAALLVVGFVIKKRQNIKEAFRVLTGRR